MVEIIVGGLIETVLAAIIVGLWNRRKRLPERTRRQNAASLRIAVRDDPGRFEVLREQAMEAARQTGQVVPVLVGQRWLTD